MSGFLRSMRANLGLEWIRWRRSRRVYLLLIPPIAAPLGSVIADLYLRIPNAATAAVLGLLIAGGLGALILVDLAALSAGEDLARRVQPLWFVLPQDRRAILAGRLLLSVGAPLAAFALSALAILVSAPLATAPGVTGSAALLFEPTHLALAELGLLLFLGGVAAAAATYARGASEAIVAGMLAGVVVAGGTAYLRVQHELTMVFPGVLAFAGIASIAWAILRFGALEG